MIAKARANESHGQNNQSVSSHVNANADTSVELANKQFNGNANDESTHTAQTRSGSVYLRSQRPVAHIQVFYCRVRPDGPMPAHDETHGFAAR